MLIGAHVSIARHFYEAIDRGFEEGCDAIQIFPGNPRSWVPSSQSAADLAEFKHRRARAGIGPVIIHLPYLVNLASPVSKVRGLSLESTVATLDLAKAIGAEYMVVHAGSHARAGEAAGEKNMADSLKELSFHDFGGVMLLIENTSGAGSSMGYRVSQVCTSVSAAGGGHLGLCLDLCHAYAAGYNIATPEGLDLMIDEIEDCLGLDRLRVIHANDCKGHLGSRLDRHEHIGKGKIGLEGFRNTINHPKLAHVPFIIETPRFGSGTEDKDNIDVLRGLVKGEG